MKIIVEIPDSKADFFIELLNNLKNVKFKIISTEKAQLIEEIKEAVDNLNLVKQNKVKANPAKDLIDEL